MSRLDCLLAAIVVVFASPYARAQPDYRIHPDEIPKQYDAARGRPALAQTSEYIRLVKARKRYDVYGRNLTVAVLDTGLNAGHQDFEKKVPIQRNFTTDNKADVNDSTDGHGHGTNVGGIIVADRIHTGIAPAARIVPLKVLDNAGTGSWKHMEQALKWVEMNHAEHAITVINISISDRKNHVNDVFDGEMKAIRDSITRLRAKRIPVVVAAGNDFFLYKSKQGMGFPAICREAVSAGAIFDADIGPKEWPSTGAVANTTAPGRLTPFSQRLHSSVSPSLATDVFAPGATLTSSGLKGEESESEMDGTSQAAPVVSGLILLAQEYYHRQTGEFPTIDQLENWLWTGPRIDDGDDEDDNVQNTDLGFYRVDAMDFLANAEGTFRRWQIEMGK